MANVFEKLSSNVPATELLSKLCKEGMSDKGIRDELFHRFGYKWSMETIRRTRIKLNINKEPEVSPKEMFNTSSFPPPGLSTNEKAQWFRGSFKTNHLYVILQSQFTQEEISVYMEEYGNLCCQFEDIVTSEFFQIDDFLKHRILINRQLILMKSFQEEIIKLTEWSTNNPIQEEESKDIKQFRIQQYRLLDQKRSDFSKTSERYDKLVAERQKIYQNLAATRKDRIDELKGGKESFFSLVSMLQSSEAEREKQGRYAALTKIASEDIKSHWREPQEFPDGTIEPLIIDGETFSEEEGE